jgi:hypothetical protein
VRAAFLLNYFRKNERLDRLTAWIWTCHPRIAKHDEVPNGALSSILCVGFGVYAVANGTGHLWLHLLYLHLSPALGALGGYLLTPRLGRAVQGLSVVIGDTYRLIQMIDLVHQPRLTNHHPIYN